MVIKAINITNEVYTIIIFIQTRRLGHKGVQ